MAKKKRGGWRLESRSRALGKAYSLCKGSRQNLVRLELRVVPEAKAQRALRAIEEEQAEGTLHRVLALYETHPESAIAYLTGDERDAALLITPERDWSRATLSEYFDEHYQAWRAETKPSTWRTEAGYWKRLLHHLGHLPICDIDARDLADYRDDYETAAPRTKALHTGAVRALLKRAYRLRHLDTLPELGQLRIEGSTRRTRDKAEPLSLDELRRLIEVSEGKYAAMWAVGAGNGLRPAEIVRVAWQDVDWHRNVLRVRGTKTDGSDARIPLTPITRAALETWHEAVGQPAQGLAFPSQRGETYSAIDALKNPFRTRLRRAGILRNLTPYDLRHSFATIAWTLGISKDHARRVMRHTGTRLLDEVYQNPPPEAVGEGFSAFTAAPEESE